MSYQKSKIEEVLMEKIKNKKIRMKPKLYFVFGSVFSIIGFASLIVFVIFLTNLILFFLRTNHFMKGFRCEQIISNFPWWALLIAILGIIIGISFLKNYDFSYKKNFLLIIFGIIISIVFASWLIDFTGVNDVFIKRGPMKDIYRKYDGRGRLQMYNNKQIKEKSIFNKDL